MSIRVGPYLDSPLRDAKMNDPNPSWIVSPHFVGRVGIRIKTPTTAHPEILEYFKERQRLFCFQIQGRFQKEWSGDDIEFGVCLAKPIHRLPFGSSLAIAFIKVLYNVNAHG